MTRTHKRDKEGFPNEDWVESRDFQETAPNPEKLFEALFEGDLVDPIPLSLDNPCDDLFVRSLARVKEHEAENRDDRGLKH